MMGHRINLLIATLVALLIPEALVAQSEKPPGGEGELASATITEGYRSTMFYDPELERIAQVIEARREGREVAQEVPEAVQEEPEELVEVDRRYTYPQFYLKSIVYRGPSDWVVWINNLKTTSHNPKTIPGLTIDFVKRDQIQVTYDFTGDPLISPPAIINDERIQLSPSQQMAKATIEPNQTWSLYSWAVFEGRVKPVTRIIRANEEQQEEAFSSQQALEGLFEEGEEDSKGLRGLINRGDRMMQQ